MVRKQRNVALYLRVSTLDQTVENQRHELRAVAKRAGWKIVGEYVDASISDINGRDKRPGFERLHKDAVAQRFDMIAAWSVDRLSRSMRHLVNFLEEIKKLGVGLYLHQQGLDTTTPAGEAMFQMCGVFAQFEKSMLQERVRAGMARARAAGKRLGRPTVSAAVRRKVLALRKAGKGIQATAKFAGCGVSAVQRIEAESRAS